MKIKLDFITNSSSTSYVVFVPQDFYPKDKDVERIYEKYFESQTGYPPSKPVKSDSKLELFRLTDIQLYNDTSMYLDMVKEGDNLWTYGFDQGLNPAMWNIILSICYENDFVLCEIPINGEGNDIIQGIQEEKIKGCLMSLFNINDNFKLLRSGGKNVREIKKK